jgi:hypothetical protein
MEEENSMNEEFKRLKEGSDRLNQMMQEIRWCIRTLEGVLKLIYAERQLFNGPIGLVVYLANQEIGQHGEWRFDAKVLVRRQTGLEIGIVALRGEGDEREYRALKLSEQWSPEEITVVYENLDAVISTAREACTAIGEGETFDRRLQEISGVSL